MRQVVASAEHPNTVMWLDQTARVTVYVRVGVSLFTPGVLLEGVGATEEVIRLPDTMRSTESNCPTRRPNLESVQNGSPRAWRPGCSVGTRSLCHRCCRCCGRLDALIIVVVCRCTSSMIDRKTS